MFVTSKINLSSAVPGMVVNEDVVSSGGLLVVPKNTVLSETIIKKMILYSIKDVSIRKAIDSEGQQPSQSKPVERSIDEKKLEVMKEKISENKAKVESSFYELNKGQEIQSQELYGFTNEILKTLDDKSQLIKYISALQNTDNCIYTHSLNVSLLCNLIATWLGFDNQKKEEVTLAGMLHDIGKLNDQSTKYNENHPINGYKMIEKSNLPKSVKLGILMHHEAVDGSGFPMQAKWDQINECAKIVAIADYYDNIAGNKKINKEDVSVFDIIKTFEQNKYGKFDTKYLESILIRMAESYIGAWIELSTGEEAKIVMINQRNLSRPVVQVDSSFIDLSRETAIEIMRVL